MANPTVILIALCFGLQLGMSHVALAQDAYPSRAITIINPFPPGGTSEIVTRPLAAALEPIVKQPVVVETKAGAAGAVGAQFVATAAPDGYTLLSHISFRLCRGRQALRAKAKVHPRRLHSHRAFHRGACRMCRH